MVWRVFVPGEIRTHGPQIRNLVLYPAALRELNQRQHAVRLYQARVRRTRSALKPTFFD